MEHNLSELKKINNLKVIFRNIRAYVAGNMTGITRDEQIAQNLMLILFCKIYDEKYNNPLNFYVEKNETDQELKARIDELLVHTKDKYRNIFDKKEKIELTGDVLRYVVKILEPYKLMDSDRDIIADAFEELIGTSFRGGEGQFFTPRNIVEMMIKILDPKIGEKIMEPACGSGGFLAYILKNYQYKEVKDYNLHGIEKDQFLSKIAKMYLAILGDPNYNVFCENSLDKVTNWKKETRSKVKLNTYDVILTNPPFGAKIPIAEPEILKQYELGYQWINKNETWELTKKLRDKQPPQILFVERIIQMLKPGGRAGIILPDGMFGNPSDRYIWEYVKKYTKIIGIVSLSQEAFQPSTHTKTSILFIQKKDKSTYNEDYNIFMATAKAVGHNKNGKEVYKIDAQGKYILDEKGEKILDDDIPEIAINFEEFLEKGTINKGIKGFVIKASEIENNIYIPEHYNQELSEKLENLSKDNNYELRTLNSLISDDYIEIKRGNEIGSQFYGTGDIPFVRTSDIVNWEIKADPVKAVADEVYEKYKDRQNIEENDILFVNDGTFLIGRSAMVTSLDKKIVIQSHLRKIRVKDNSYINAFYLFYLLNLDIVQQQIKKKIFTQATLSTLGNRLGEVLLPIHTNEKIRDEIGLEIKKIFDQKVSNKKRMTNLFKKYEL